MNLRVEITFFQLYKWQATLRSESFRGMSCGVTRLQFSSTLGHRLAKRHPAGTFTGEGISPRIVVEVLHPLHRSWNSLLHRSDPLVG